VSDWRLGDTRAIAGKMGRLPEGGGIVWGVFNGEAGWFEEGLVDSVALTIQRGQG
jgi:hypothetical protein